jgi:ribonuclease R
MPSATPVTGGLLFDMLSEPLAPDPATPRPRLGVRARGDRRPGGPKPPKRPVSGRPPGIRTGRKKKMGGKRR